MKRQSCSDFVGQANTNNEGITNKGSEKLEMEVKCLYEDIMTLKTAIEEAIIKGQKSLGDLNDIPGSGMIFKEDFPLTHTNAGSQVVGWLDDF